jgi:hypothetical protein
MRVWRIIRPLLGIGLAVAAYVADAHRGPASPGMGRFTPVLAVFGIDDILIALAISGGASAISAAANGAASSGAANSQKDSVMAGIDLQKEIARRQDANYQQSRADQAPWLQAGQSSLGELMAQMQGGYFDRQFDPSQLANDPGYQFRMAEGQKALERSASARGLLNSGGALKSLSRYSQGVASDEFQNAWNRNQAENTGRYNRLAGIAGLGQQQAQSLGSLGAQNSAQMGQGANSMSSLYGAYGNAGSAQAMGVGNAISNGANMFGGLLGYGFMNGGGGGGGMQIPQQNTYSGSMVSGSGQGFGPYTYGGG